MNKELEDALETLVDSHSLPAVVSALADVALAKAEHIRWNWQDENLASRWDSAGLDLEGAFTKVERRFNGSK